jgi:hypothetical protein
MLNRTAGVSAGAAGVMLSTYNFVGLPHSLLVPMIYHLLQELSSLRIFFQQSRYQRRPSGLVTGPEAPTGFSVEIFVEKN